MKQIAFFIVALLAFGCKTYNEEDKQSFDQKIEKFIAKSNTKFERSESGLYYFIDKKGDGENIKFTDEVSFTYMGKLLNGTVFDGKNEKKPVTFPVNQLIMGWQEAFMYMRKGDKAKLIIPPSLGYGDHDLESIPPHSILYFEVEITDVK